MSGFELRNGARTHPASPRRQPWVVLHLLSVPLALPVPSLHKCRPFIKETKRGALAEPVAHGAAQAVSGPQLGSDRRRSVISRDTSSHPTLLSTHGWRVLLKRSNDLLQAHLLDAFAVEFPLAAVDENPGRDVQ